MHDTCDDSKIDLGIITASVAQIPFLYDFMYFGFIRYINKRIKSSTDQK